MICEMHIDDCNVFGDTNIEFVSSLKFFGFSEFKFVGKVVFEKGFQISRTKIQSVLDFPSPTASKQLKSF